MAMFQKATRKKLKARCPLDGPSGSGKTYTGLRFAFTLAGPTGRVAVLDTEHRSASKYQGMAPDGIPWDFDVCELTNYAPSTYTQIIRGAGRAGYDVLVIDSLSHAWEGTGGALDMVDRKGGNSFTAWRDVTPLHREMVEAILQSPCHVIATMRTKMEYVLEEQVNKSGKKTSVPKKVGMAPIQRAGMEYEFDIVCDIDLGHVLTVSKTRCPGLDGQKAVKPGAEFIAPLAAWLGEGVEAATTADQGAEVSTPTPPPAASGETTGNIMDEKPKDKGDPKAPRKARKGVKLGGKQTDSGKVPTQDLTRELCSDAQRGAIVDLAKRAGVGPDKLKAACKKRGKSALAELTIHEADEIIAKLTGAAQVEECPF